MIIFLQCKKYHQQTPKHAQVHFVFQWHKEVVNLRDELDDGGIDAEVDKPLVLGEISQVDNVEVCDVDGFQLDVKVPWYVETRRLFRVCVAIPLILPFAWFILRHTS
jgi:hypothetical protein